MKKAVLAAGIALVLSFPSMAAEPSTLTDRADRLDEVVYGSIQNGSFLERIDSLDTEINGSTDEKATEGQGLDTRIDRLYNEVIRSDNDSQPSLDTRVNTLEYYLTDKIKQDPLSSRVDTLDSTVFGKEQTGGLASRVTALEKAVYGDNHYELTTVTLPENTVFKISMNDEVSSKTNQVGDPVHCTVAEDVTVDNVLVLPRGAQGSGVITKVNGPKFFGRSGSLEISFDQVISIDEDTIPTVLGPEAKEQIKMQAAAVGASAIGALALGPIGLVGGFFVKGKDVDIPAGTELYIQTSEAVTTKGMEMKPGAPVEMNVSSSVSRSANISDTEVSRTVDKVAEKAADKKETVKETAGKTSQKVTEDTTKTDNKDKTSVVIVRNA
ncbi:hypothetical protein [Allisonella histaminiformans]|uniref:hypothetical protein n=1 Tax=Allisonella histaminiformans TaxID=209880 RepID=UPI0026EE205F|nr:hypothetical protein [Allisonella histaminiformans]